MFLEKNSANSEQSHKTKKIFAVSIEIIKGMRFNPQGKSSQHE